MFKTNSRSKLSKLTFILVLTLIFSTLFASNVFASVPDSTVLLGTKAFDLQYVNADHLKEVQQALVECDNKVYVKTPSGIWVHNSSGIELTLEEIKSLPEITYICDDYMDGFLQGDGESFAKLYDFWKVRWGMSPEEVKASENEKPRLDSDTLTYYENIEVFGKMADSLAYFYKDSKLYHISVEYNPKYSNRNDYIKDYYFYKNQFVYRYGEPEFDDILELEDYWTDYTDDYGIALWRNYIQYFNVWEDVKTEAYLSVFRLGDRITTLISVNDINNND